METIKKKGGKQILITILLKLSEFIINPLLNITSKIFATIGLDDIMLKIKEVTDIIFQFGGGLIGLFFDFGILNTVLNIVITVEIGYELYKITMWAIKKIPKFNVS